MYHLCLASRPVASVSLCARPPSIDLGYALFDAAIPLFWLVDSEFAFDPIYPDCVLAASFPRDLFRSAVSGVSGSFWKVIFLALGRSFATNNNEQNRGHAPYGAPRTPGRHRPC